MLKLGLLVVLGLIVLGSMIVAALNRRVDSDNSGVTHDIRIGAYIAAAIAALIAIVFGGINSFYTQDPGEAVVVRSFTGNIVGQTTQPGAHFKAPWNSIESFDIRNQKLEMYSNAGGEGADGAALSVPLKGGANASVSITVIYSIQPDSVTSIYERFRTQEGLRDNALKASLRDIVRNETSVFEPLEVKEQRSKLGNQIEAALEEAWAPYGVIVDQVNLGDITLDAATEEAISKVITAQQEVEQARAGLEKAQIAAEITKTEAQAQADADQIIRCGADISYEVRTINGVDTEVVVVTPKSNEECENRLNEQVLLTKYFDALRDIGAEGNMVVVIPEGGATPIITLPSSASSTTGG